MGTMSAACFRPAGASTLFGAAAYAAYLAWLATGLAAELGTTALVHLLLAVTTLGAWVGACVARIRAWPNVVLVPGFGAAATVPAVGVAFAGLGCNVAVAWLAGLDPWSFGAVGLFALSASMVGGTLLPGAAVYLHLGMWLALIPANYWERNALAAADVVPAGVWAVVAVCGFGLLAAFAFPGRPGGRAALGTAWLRLGLPRIRTVWEPAVVRVTCVFGAFAVGAALVQRALEAGLKDQVWMILIVTLCANTALGGTSVASPRGLLPGASRLLLLGVARRTGVGRRVQRKIATDSLAAITVFSVATAVLGADLRLVEMVLLGFAASSVYASVAAPSRWLMAGRLSGLVGTPVVVVLALAAWEWGLRGLPATAGAWIAATAVAILVGGIGIGRLDLDGAQAGEIPTK
ncbi:MAG: hypothetical protein OXG82_15170 [Gammaproteobacteria bacterium]|nr:hypothetical protein [Gammaproteobacteria bacterium]